MKYTGIPAGLFALMIQILVLCFACYGMETGAENGEEDPVDCYHISHVQGEIDWDRVPKLDLDDILWLPDQGVRAFGQFCYEKDMLHVHLRATESDIRAEYTEPLSPVCQDSCLEFFFMPEGEDRYFNYEINPNGCLYIGFGHGRSDSTALYREDMQDLLSVLECHRIRETGFPPAGGFWDDGV